jgi:hypothetical protein
MITTNNVGKKDDDGAEPKKGSPIILILAFIVIALFFAAILTPGYVRSPNQGQFTQCQSNCKNIGTALEMYSTDNKGHYPPNIPCLSPIYLKSIPTCASAGRDTYSGSYTVIVAQKKGEVDAYTFFCSGNNHSKLGISPNYPQYDSTNGLTAK